MTFGEMQTEVFQRAEESSGSPVFWSLVDIKRALNDAYHEMCEYAGCQHSNITVSLDDETYYDLNDVNVNGGANIVYPRFIYNDQTSRWMPAAHFRDMDVQTFDWEAATGQPDQWFMRGNWMLGTFPKLSAAAGTMVLNCVVVPGDMLGALISPDFPKEFHDGIVSRALAELFCQHREFQLAKKHVADYKNTRDALRQWAMKRDYLDRRPVLGGGRD